MSAHTREFKRTLDSKQDFHVEPKNSHYVISPHRWCGRSELNHWGEKRPAPFYEASGRDCAMRMSVEESFSLSWDNLIRGMTACMVVLVLMLAAILGLVLEDFWLKIVIVLLFFCVLIFPLPSSKIEKPGLVQMIHFNFALHFSGSRILARWNI